MPAPVFITNDSDIRLEGLYIKERNPPAVIQGRFLGNIGIYGETIRGPIGKVVEITGEQRFKDVFGGRDQGSGGATIVNKVWRSLLNKQFGKVMVVRVAAAAAAKASSTLADVAPLNIVRLDASSVGSWGGNVTYAVKAATDADSNHFNLEVTYLGKLYKYENLDCTTGHDNTLKVIGTDDANIITLTKLNSGRPLNATGTLGAGGASPVAGTDGSVADSDYNTARAFLDAYPKVAAIFPAEHMSASLKSSIATAAAATSDREYLIGPDDETVTKSSAVTEAASYRSQHIIYCFNHLATIDPETQSEVWTSPWSLMGSIYSQTDVDVHPGDEDNKVYAAGMTRLYNEGYTRLDYVDLHDAGICAVEKEEGFAFVSGVVNDLTPSKQEITRRRSANFLNLSMSDFLKHTAKKSLTDKLKNATTGTMTGWLKGLKNSQRIVKAFVVDPDVLNTDQSLAAGVWRILMRVKLLPHALEVVLETEIGTTVQITERQ